MADRVCDSQPIGTYCGRHLETPSTRLVLEEVFGINHRPLIQINATNWSLKVATYLVTTVFRHLFSLKSHLSLLVIIYWPPLVNRVYTNSYLCSRVNSLQLLHISRRLTSRATITGRNPLPRSDGRVSTTETSRLSMPRQWYVSQVHNIACKQHWNRLPCFSDLCTATFERADVDKLWMTASCDSPIWILFHSISTQVLTR